MSTHTYSIATDTANAKVSTPKLLKEIETSSIAQVLNRIDTNGDSLLIVFDVVLSETEQTTLISLIAAHDGESTPVTEEPAQVQSTSYAFADKITKGGKKLFRRKHGVQATIPANNYAPLSIIVPYPLAKINKIEIINGKSGDTIDFKVYDTPTGTLTSIANHMLNQFGFNVCVAPEFYVDESNYDADLIQNMKIEITYKNNSTSDVLIGMNVTLHELK